MRKSAFGVATMLVGLLLGAIGSSPRGAKRRRQLGLRTLFGGPGRCYTVGTLCFLASPRRRRPSRRPRRARRARLTSQTRRTGRVRGAVCSPCAAAAGARREPPPPGRGFEHMAHLTLHDGEYFQFCRVRSRPAAYSSAPVLQCVGRLGSLAASRPGACRRAAGAGARSPAPLLRGGGALIAGLLVAIPRVSSVSRARRSTRSTWRCYGALGHRARRFARRPTAARARRPEPPRRLFVAKEAALLTTASLAVGGLAGAAAGLAAWPRGERGGHGLAWLRDAARATPAVLACSRR